MIRHILKIILNERRSNLWILLEYTLVFSVLWFCCDYCSAILRTYKSDPGIDIRDTYRIEMGYRIIKNTDEPEPEYDRFALTMTFLERVKRHPDVAYVALGRYAIPYSGSVATSGWMLNVRFCGSRFPGKIGYSRFFPGIQYSDPFRTHVPVAR